MHTDDNYYENLYYSHHSDEHDQEPIKPLPKRIKSQKSEVLQEISDNNKQFLQRYKRKFQSNEVSRNLYLTDLNFCPDQQEDSSILFTRYSFGYDQICSRCICISSILRNLSFISGNDIELVKCNTLIHLLARLLLLKHNNEHISLSDNELSNGQSEVIEILC